MAVTVGGRGRRPQITCTIVGMKPVLPADSEVHLWFFDLDVDQASLPGLRRLLTPSEIARAERFLVPAAARRFIAARAALRRILGQVTDTAPHDISFRYGERGKPAVPFDGLHFNASDSCDIVVVALASAEIGVDLEHRRSLRTLDRLARRLCTEAELEQLQAVGEDERNDTLLRLWTVKEAALKAIGTGLPGGLRNVEVDFGTGLRWRLRHLCGDREGWSLVIADPRPGSLCSIVVRGADRARTIRRHWLEFHG